MDFFKDYIRKRSHLEACIANVCMYEKALGFCVEYSKLYTHTKRREWNNDKEPRDYGKILKGSVEEKQLSLGEH